MICLLLRLISFAVLTYLWPLSILKVKSSSTPTCYLSNAGIPLDSIDPNSTELLDHVVHRLISRKVQGFPSNSAECKSGVWAGPQDPWQGPACRLFPVGSSSQALCLLCVLPRAVTNVSFISSLDSRLGWPYVSQKLFSKGPCAPLNEGKTSSITIATHNGR